jgi:VanZ family protein
LTFMAFLSFAGKEFKIGFSKVLFIAFSLIIFAVLDELHQKLIPGRTCSVRDVASDVTGILASTIFTLWAFISIRTRLKKSE